jgi:hypothetical protein
MSELPFFFAIKDIYLCSFKADTSQLCELSARNVRTIRKMGVLKFLFDFIKLNV